MLIPSLTFWCSFDTKSLNNEPCKFRPTIIDLNPDKLFQGLHHYLYFFSLDNCNESCNTFPDSSNEICVPNKTKDVSVKVFNKFKGLNPNLGGLFRDSFVRKYTLILVPLLKAIV